MTLSCSAGWSQLVGEFAARAGSQGFTTEELIRAAAEDAIRHACKKRGKGDMWRDHAKESGECCRGGFYVCFRRNRRRDYRGGRRAGAAFAGLLIGVYLLCFHPK